MLRRFLFYSFIICLIAVGVGYTYVLYRPQYIDTYTDNIDFPLNNLVTVEEFDAIIEEKETVNVIFYQNNEVNSQYLFNVTLTSVLSNYRLDRFEDIYYVDVSELASTSDLILSNKYGITSTPAICNISYNKLQITVNSILCMEKNNLTVSEISAWLKEHNIIEEAH